MLPLLHSVQYSGASIFSICRDNPVLVALVRGVTVVLVQPSPGLDTNFSL